jgi:hypothetical protein
MYELRYIAAQVDGQWFVWDTKDDLPVSESMPEGLAQLTAGKLNNIEMRRGKAQETVLNAIRAERARQDQHHKTDGKTSSAEWLAILAKKLGDTAASLLNNQPRSRELEQELVEVAAVAVAWLEDIDASR